MDCSDFALEQGIFVCFQRINLPFVRTVAPDIPLLQTLRQSVESSLNMPSAFPVNDLADITATGFPYPRFVFGVVLVRVGVQPA